MHTAQSIESMSDHAARKTAEALARTLLESDRFKTDLAELVGVKRQTVNNWFASRPPTLVILYLQAETQRRDLLRRIDGMKSGLSGILQVP